MTPQICIIKRGFQGEKTQSILFRLSSAVIRVYLWFNKISFVLLKLIQ